MNLPVAAIVFGLFWMGACNRPAPSSAKIEMQVYGKLANGSEVDLYTLTNSQGLQAGVITYGARLVSLKTPDRAKHLDDIILGFDSLDGYLKDNPYFGAVVGRYGNRIGKGKFSLNGQEYTLAKNNGENSLHGGVKGFDKVLWTARDVSTSGAPGVELTYLSPDGEEGFPGNLLAKVTYTLSDSNELKIDYTATSDKLTVVNLTNHAYFNLSGEDDVMNHVLTIAADKFTPVDSGLIPTGELKSVEGTPFDFRKPTPIGSRINDNDAQLKLGGGYDHNFVLNHPDGEMGLAARVSDPKSGRVMEIQTVEPGVQFYTGNFLDGSLKGKAGKVYGKRSAFCLETQHFPDSPNKPAFPSTALRQGDRYRTTTVLRFTTE
jgi:aldose 1-epimerase